MDGVAGYPGWRWLYILEGLITLVWAVMCIYLVPKNYQTAYFLDDEDKKIMAIRAELSESYSGGDGHYKMKDLKLAWGDTKTWLHGISQIAVVTILYGFGTFLPIIIKNGLREFRLSRNSMSLLRGLWSRWLTETLRLFDQASTIPCDSCQPLGCCCVCCRSRHLRQIQ